MNEDTVIELEKFIFATTEKPGVAARIMADIIGVLIDLKPAMIGEFNKDKFTDSNYDKFEEILDKLNLRRVYFDRDYLSNNKKIEIKCFCLSKQMFSAEKTHEAFVELWSTIDDSGRVLNREKWVEISRKIGELLGYPKTAVDSFVEDDGIANEERTKRIARNRYYAHSAKYEDEEFKSYDQKLNMAISNLAPKTAELFSSNEQKRWLV